MPYSNTATLHWDYRDGRVAAVVAAVVYSMWTLEVVLPGGPGTATGALADPESTLGLVLDSAHRTAAILVVLAAGLGLTLGAKRPRSWLTVSWWSMAVFGAASLTASLLPGRCVVSTDAACTVESLVEGSQGATATQTVLAVVAALSALLASAALTRDRRRARERAWPALALITVAQAVAAVVVLVLAAMAYASSGDGSPGVALGLAERAHLVTVALWLLAVGVVPGQWKRSRGQRSTVRPAD
ncbi:hypothetical protein GCM10007079_15250 [Nocardiopsis terrae]|uniref:Small-conductance mechanosensitive channel n=1 Tax=Nocardiopsis terrae TaxID=372655 RepID=A0ABR9HB67_9ACTN|nr:DUF998 domain-containing protein [Nocardiopsis terrae]MBE1456272.1 small-conductance mechanosensitive channel [Nocardiopsis terrae]GHC77792.1 hypothetical protein GCM10007079_15250 [Nocardiopsis terrae]